MSETTKRKLPALEADTAFFWTSGSDGALHIQRCGDCGRWQHPPLPCCPSCHGQHMAPQTVCGRGKVATFTINYESWFPGLDVPFVFAAVELDEQAELYVFSNVVGPVQDVRIGLPVSVFFEPHDDVLLPLFLPVDSAHD